MVKKFVEQMNSIFESDSAYIKASLPMKLIAYFVDVIYSVVRLIAVVIMFVTVPVWAIPYAIWWCAKRRNE